MPGPEPEETRWYQFRKKDSGISVVTRYNKGVNQTPTKIPVSAVLITRDAELWLDEVLDALDRFDEVLILDSGSEDRTEEIAGLHRVVWREHDFDGYGPQKQRAVRMARYDWVLSVDADEVLDPDTVGAISDIDWGSMDKRTCCTIRRRPFVGSREIRHGHWVPDPVVRLFNRQHHTFSSAHVHESVEATGPVLALPGSMAHHSYQDLAGLFRADYHRLKAIEYRRSGRRLPGVLSLTARAGWAFFYSLVVKRGFLDGPAGVVIALSSAVNAVLGLALAGESPAASKQPHTN